MPTGATVTGVDGIAGTAVIVAAGITTVGKTIAVATIATTAKTIAALTGITVMSGVTAMITAAAITTRAMLTGVHLPGTMRPRRAIAPT